MLQQQKGMSYAIVKRVDIMPVSSTQMKKYQAFKIHTRQETPSNVVRPYDETAAAEKKKTEF
jgi:hypothetical protein